MLLLFLLPCPAVHSAPVGIPNACLTFSTRHGMFSFESRPMGSKRSGIGSSSCVMLHVDVTSEDTLFSLSSSTGDPNKETRSLNLKHECYF